MATFNYILICIVFSFLFYGKTIIDCIKNKCISVFDIFPITMYFIIMISCIFNITVSIIIMIISILITLFIITSYDRVNKLKNIKVDWNERISS